MSTFAAYLPADAVALTGAAELYLGFLARAGIVRPLKHRNGRTDLATEADIERDRWAAERRDQLSVGADVTG